MNKRTDGRKHKQTTLFPEFLIYFFTGYPIRIELARLKGHSISGKMNVYSKWVIYV